jgi:hypothetical protein
VTAHEKSPPPAATLALFSRRNLMLGGLGAAAVAGLGGLGLALQSTVRGPAPSDALQVLTLDEHAIVAAVARRVCPEPGPDVPGADAIDVGLLADRLLASADEHAVADVKTVLALFESGLVGAVFLERARPFTALSPTDQDRVLLAWRGSSVLLRRSVYRALASLCTSLYYADPRVFPGIGYPGPPDPAALRRAYADQLVDLAALRAPGHELEGSGA